MSSTTAQHQQHQQYQQYQQQQQQHRGGAHDKPPSSHASDALSLPKVAIITNNSGEDKDKDKDKKKVKAHAHANATGIYSFAQRSLNRVVSPESRQRAYNGASSLATTRPILFSFASTQLLFASLPLLIFASFAVSIIAFAIVTAVVFAFFWVGLALLLLVPALFLTFSVAVFFWAWAVGSFLVVRWLYNHAPVVLERKQQQNGPVYYQRTNDVKDEHRD